MANERCRHSRRQRVDCKQRQIAICGPRESPLYHGKCNYSYLTTRRQRKRRGEGSLTGKPVPVHVFMVGLPSCLEEEKSVVFLCCGGDSARGWPLCKSRARQRPTDPLAHSPSLTFRPDLIPLRKYILTLTTACLIS